MLEFAWSYLFYALPLPLLVWYFLPRAHKSFGAALKTPLYENWTQLIPHQTNFSTSNDKRWILSSLAWIFLVLAAAKPQWIGDPIQLPLSGRDLMMAVDLSGSMERPDFMLHGKQVDRLTAVKAIGGEFIQGREGDRIGLIVFGAQAYVATPLSFDRQTVNVLLQESEIGLAGKETAIGDAIGLAVKRLSERPTGSRVLILITDGANTAGEIEPLKAAELAKQAGLRIYTIGVGADRMEIQTLFGRQTVNPSVELDEQTLTQIARSTGGIYFRAKNTEGLQKIYQKLDKLEPVESDVRMFRPIKSLYFWPLGASLGLFLLLALYLNWSRFRMQFVS